jgi:hypothetical protein
MHLIPHLSILTLCTGSIQQENQFLSTLQFESRLWRGVLVTTTGTRIPDPPFSSFGPSRDYGMDLCLEVYF